MTNSPNTPVVEKYSRGMEAYQIEMEYGRNIEAYTGDLHQADRTRTVEFLRIGRIALMYLTLDGQEAGYWDKDAETWRTLPEHAHRSISQGLRIARKQAPPDFIEVPVPGPKSTQ